jgi:hypothetical protein
MAFESVRSYLQLASGLGEMTRARAMEAAQGILSLPGADEVTRRAVQASALADQLLEAARSNRDSLVALVQGEVETAIARADVARVADLEAARAALAAVAQEVAELRATVLATGAAAVSTAARGGRPRPSSGAVTTRMPLTDPAMTSNGGLDAGTTAPPRTRATTKATAKTATTKATAKKSTAKKSTTRKAAAKKAAATSTAKKAAATSTAKKSAAKKAAAAKKTTAKKTTAKKSAAKKSTARKSTAKKSAAKRASQ